MSIDFPLELQRLKAHYDETQEKLRKYRELALQQQNEKCQKRKASLNAYRDKESKLKASIAKLMQGSNHSKDLKAERERLEKVKFELQQAEDLRKILKVTKEQKEKNVEKLSEEVQKVKQDTAEETSSEKTLKTLETACEQYSNCLGLTFKKTAGHRIQVIFSHINENQPDDIFYFFISLSEDRQYIISDPQPPVSNLDELVDKLNKTNNLCAFTKAMRNKFKETLRRP